MAGARQAGALGASVGTGAVALALLPPLASVLSAHTDIVPRTAGFAGGVAVVLVPALGLGALLGALAGVGLGPRAAKPLGLLGGALWALTALNVAVMPLAFHPLPLAAPQVGPLPAPGAPDIVVVVIDTLRADVLDREAVGADAMPHLRALGEAGRTYPRAFAAAPWSWPSTAALMTGRYAGDVGGLDSILPEGPTTLAEHFAAQGYATAAFSDNSIVSTRAGYAQGFATFRQRSGAYVISQWRGYQWLPETLSDRLLRTFGLYYEGAGPVTDAVLAWLDAPSERPAFVYVHYMDPHYPYYRQPEALEALGLDPPDVGAWFSPYNQAMYTAPYPDDLGVTDAERAELHGRYLGEVRAMDDHLGRLVEGLRARGRWRDTVLVVTSDHGEEFFEHGMWGHGHSLAEHQLHVPLVLHGPGVPPGVDPRRVSTIGLARTLTALAGVADLPDAEPPLPLDDAPERDLYAETVRRGRRMHLHRTGDAKTIRTQPVDGDVPPTYVAYAVDRDPAERAPTAPGPEGVDAVEAFATRNGQHHGELTEAQRAQLEALGYIDE